MKLEFSDEMIMLAQWIGRKFEQTKYGRSNPGSTFPVTPDMLGVILNYVHALKSLGNLDAIENMVQFVANCFASSMEKVGRIDKLYESGELTAEEAFQKLVSSYESAIRSNAPKSVRAICGDGIKPVCKRGCNWCCAIPAVILGPEIELIQALSTEEAAKHAQVTAGAEMSGNPDLFGKHSFKERLCPFNKNGECSIYEKRPLACRNHMVAITSKHCEDYDGISSICSPLSGIIFLACASMLSTKKEFLRTAIASSCFEEV